MGKLSKLPPMKAPGTLQFVTMGETIDRGITGIIYSDPGVGKTTTASTLPVGETLFIMAEAGYGPLLGTGHIVFNLNTDLGQLEDLYKFLRTQPHPFKNVVLDNISEMESWFVTTLTQGRQKDFAEISEYGNAAYKLREYLLLFRDLADVRKMNVIFNAWEMSMEIKNTAGEVITKTYPKLFKKLAPEICGIVDFVAHLECYDKTGDRWMRMHPQKNLVAKCQFKGIDAEEPANLPSLFAKIRAFDYAPAEVASGE
jgi:phage nucleotide-binding protein